MIIKLRKLGSAELVVVYRETINVYRILVCKPQGER
jgi:hypothetical protein